MTLIADVDMETFVRFKQQDAVFFWTETKKAFILLRPEIGVIIRTMAKKTTEKEDEKFRMRNLQSKHGIYCEAFSFTNIK